MADATEAPTKLYRLQVLQTAPFHNLVAGGVTFQRASDAVVGKRGDGTSRRALQEGLIQPLTDDQVVTIKVALERLVVQDGKVFKRGSSAHRPRATDLPVAHFLNVWDEPLLEDPRPFRQKPKVKTYAEAQAERAAATQRPARRVTQHAGPGAGPGAGGAGGAADTK